ncbi:MAG TPA: GNAT family N-acetyltransferase [Thermoanaerobaculia bacterium]|nr:GNAT family N-acetyltransferase [Thermoanaerobaculia bacterium]
MIGRIAEAATEADVAELAALRTRVAFHLTEEYGAGHWSAPVSERGVWRGIQESNVLVTRQAGAIVATLRAAKKKPWAIDPAYFTRVRKPLYILDMAVEPSFQRQGLGRQLLADAEVFAREYPADALRLDAYDAPAGAGAFYLRCGYREVGRVVYRRTPLVYFERLL